MPPMPIWSAWVGWAFAAAAFFVGYQQYGWPGVLLAFTMVVFWLLIQMSRALRTLRSVKDAPVGYVVSAVMVNSKLHAGMRLVDVLRLTKSLGDKLSDPPDESYRWTDRGHNSVTIHLSAGRLVRWNLLRPEAGSDATGPASGVESAS